MSDETRAAIQAYPWPGNVRELENKIKRAVIMAGKPVIQPADLELPWGGTSKSSTPTLKEARAQLEKELIQQALATQSGNISRAAEELGISRQGLHVLIQKYGLDDPQ